MTSEDVRLLHRSDALLHAEGSRLDHLFDLHLRAASPALANAVASAASALGASPVHLVTTAVIAAAGQSDPAQAVKSFDILRHATRVASQRDALLGQALMAALAAVLGDDFRGATREAWSDGYVRLVETVMASRNNRFELVA